MSSSSGLYKQVFSLYSSGLICCNERKPCKIWYDYIINPRLRMKRWSKRREPVLCTVDHATYSSIYGQMKAKNKLRLYVLNLFVTVTSVNPLTLASGVILMCGAVQQGSLDTVTPYTTALGLTPTTQSTLNMQTPSKQEEEANGGIWWKFIFTYIYIWIHTGENNFLTQYFCLVFQHLNILE